MWAYGTSPYGLGLDEDALWSLTPREFAALKKQHEQSRLPIMWTHAALQATLHNAHFRGEHQPAFQASQFMPAEYQITQTVDADGWKRTMTIVRAKLEVQRKIYQDKWDRENLNGQ